MTTRTLALLTAVLSLASATAWAHGDQRLGVEPQNEQAFPAGVVSYDFQVLDLKQRVILADSDFELSHDEKVQVFVYDPGLKRLQHLQATYQNGLWHSDLPLAQNGEYWVWAEGQLVSDHTTGYGSSRLLVTGGFPEDSTAPDTTERRTATDGTSQVTLSADPIVKEQEVMLGLTYSRTDCSEPAITPYLGEMGHAILVSEDGDWLTDAPVMMDDLGKLMLPAKFPEEGNYRVWVQFVDGGALKTVSMAVAVSEGR